VLAACLLLAAAAALFSREFSSSYYSSSNGISSAVGRSSEGTSSSSDRTITLPLQRQLVPLVTIGSTVHYKSAYWGTLSVGTPAVGFKVVFDTGSGHLILPSTYCHSNTCRAHKRYRRSATSSALDIDGDGQPVSPTAPRDQITVSFGTGQVEGVFVDDVVCVGDSHAQKAIEAAKSEGRPMPGTAQSANAGLPEPPAVVDKDCMRMRMIIATDMSEEPFRTFDFDGVLGLGLASLSQTREFNFMHSVASSILGESQIFAVFLAEGASSEASAASEITLGGWKPERLRGPLSWNEVIHPELGHWMLAVRSIRVDDTVISFCKEGCRAVADTGTSLLAVPPGIFPELFDLMKYNPEEDHCRGDGPKIHLELDTVTLTLGPSDYGSRFVKGTSEDGSEEAGLFETTASPKQDMCKPMMMSMELPEPVGPKLFVLGEPVLRKYYTVFDAAKNKIGFGIASPASAAERAS
jgi:hypothetical protein